MEPLLASVTTTVAHDVRELVHAAELEPPALLEKDPPNWRWGFPLGFVTVATAGMLLVAAGGVHERVREQRHGARRHSKTRLHKHKVRAHGAPLPRPAS